MAILHGPYDRTLFVIGGMVKKSGGSLNLVKGQLALVDGAATTKDGAAVLSTVAGLNKDLRTLELRLGVDERTPTRSTDNKPYSTMPFSINEIKSLKVSAPKRTEMSLEEVILGYNGIDDNTSFNLEVGESYKRFCLEISGNEISYLGGGTSTETICINHDVPQVNQDECCDPLTDFCDPCLPVDCKAWTLEVIEKFKNYQLVGGKRLGELIEITPVFKCDTPAAPVLIPYDFYCLEVCDTGDAAALALVQGQYPDAIVACVDRKGSKSKYQVLLPQADGAPVDLELTLASYIKGCEDCDTDFTELPGGALYSIAIEDDGADLSGTFATILGAAGLTVVPTVVREEKVLSQAFGIGHYNVVLDSSLTASDIQLLTAYISTAALPENTLTFIKIGDVNSICENATVETIAWAICGTCNVVEECYLISLPDTECGDSRLVELQSAYKDLVIEEVVGSEAGCQRKYKATVKSNLVCEECDPVFLDSFKTEAPSNYDLAEWVYDTTDNVATAPSGNCKCGIRFKSKPFVLKSGECYRDRINFVEDCLRIRVSGGFPDEIREGIGKTPKEIFSVTRISKFEPRTHLGGNLTDFEKRDKAFFGDGPNGDNLYRQLRGTQSNIIDQCTQYVDYALTVAHENHSQGFAQRHSEDTVYHIFVEVGRNKDVEDVLNSLAAAKGVATVSA